MCFINKFMSFCKIIGFTKQIYENKSLSSNHVFYFCASSQALSAIYVSGGFKKLFKKLDGSKSVRERERSTAAAAKHWAKKIQ